MRRIVLGMLMVSVATTAFGAELPALVQRREAVVVQPRYQPLRLVPPCYDGPPGLLNCAPRVAEEECPAASPYCFQVTKRRYRPYIQMFSWNN